MVILLLAKIQDTQEVGLKNCLVALQSSSKGRVGRSVVGVFKNFLQLTTVKVPIRLYVYNMVF